MTPEGYPDDAELCANRVRKELECLRAFRARTLAVLDEAIAAYPEDVFPVPDTRDDRIAAHALRTVLPHIKERIVNGPN